MKITKVTKVEYTYDEDGKVSTVTTTVYEQAPQDSHYDWKPNYRQIPISEVKGNFWC